MLFSKFVRSKCNKMHYEDIPLMHRNVLEFFYVPLYTEFLSGLYKKFQVASAYDTNIEYQIW